MRLELVIDSGNASRFVGKFGFSEEIIVMEEISLKIRNDDNECFICFSTFLKSDLVTLNNCNHSFCISCCKSWIIQNHCCPFDRLEIISLTYYDKSNEERLIKPVNTFITEAVTEKYEMFIYKCCNRLKENCSFMESRSKQYEKQIIDNLNNFISFSKDNILERLQKCIKMFDILDEKTLEIKNVSRIILDDWKTNYNYYSKNIRFMTREFHNNRDFKCKYIGMLQRQINHIHEIGTYQKETLHFFRNYLKRTGTMIHQDVYKKYFEDILHDYIFIERIIRINRTLTNMILIRVLDRPQYDVSNYITTVDFNCVICCKLKITELIKCEICSTGFCDICKEMFQIKDTNCFFKCNGKLIRRDGDYDDQNPVDFKQIIKSYNDEYLQYICEYFGDAYQMMKILSKDKYSYDDTFNQIRDIDEVFKSLSCSDDNDCYLMIITIKSMISKLLLHTIFTRIGLIVNTLPWSITDDQSRYIVKIKKHIFSLEEKLTKLIEQILKFHIEESPKTDSMSIISQMRDILENVSELPIIIN